jgi:hypothetical protein
LRSSSTFANLFTPHRLPLLKTFNSDAIFIAKLSPEIAELLYATAAAPFSSLYDENRYYL